MPDPNDRRLSSDPTTDAEDPAEAAEAERRIDSDAGLSPVIEQQGGAALANLGKARSSELFKPDKD